MYIISFNFKTGADAKGGEAVDNSDVEIDDIY